MPKPDAVVFIDMTVEEICARAGFGEEKYESMEFQKKVAAMYKQIFDPNYWIRFAGAKAKDTLHSEIIDALSKASSKIDPKNQVLF